MKRYAFALSEFNGPGEGIKITNGSGSANTVAQLMRAAADEIDPPKEEPEYQHIKGFGDDILQEFLGNPGKKSQQ